MDDTLGLQWVSGPDGARTHFNQGWLDLTGSTEAELLGWGWLAVLHPDDRTAYVERYRAAIDNRSSFAATARIRAVDDAYVTVVEQGAPWGDGFSGIALISEQREDPLAASGFAAPLLDTLDQAVCVVDSRGTIRAWNRAAADLYRLPASEAVGAPLGDVLAPAGGDAASGPILERFAAGEAWQGDMLVRRRDGTTFLGHVTIQPIHGTDGSIAGYIGLSRNVTVERARQVTSEESQQLFRTVAQAASALIAIFRPDDQGDLQLRYANQEWEGYVPGSTTGQAVERRQVLHPDDIDQEEANQLREKLRQAQPFDREVRLRNAEGEYRWHLVRYRPVLDDNGMLAMTVLVGVDIHERRTLEQGLTRQQEISRRIADEIPALLSLSVAGEDGRLQPAFFNRTWEEYTGLSSAQLLGPDRARIYAPDDADRIDSLTRTSAIGDRSAGEFRFRRHDGEDRWHSVLHRRIPMPAGSPAVYVTIAMDIHERRAAEKESARLAAIVGSSQDAIISYSFDGQIATWNAGAERLYGYKPEEVVGRSIDIIVPPGHHETTSEMRSVLMAGEEVAPFETVRQTKDGRHLTVMLTLSPIIEGSTVTGISAIARDISREKELVSDLRRANAVKDEFLALVSHELRTPLTAVVGLSRRLDRSLADKVDQETGDTIRDTYMYAQRLQRTVENMLVLARLDHHSVEFEPILVQRIIAHSVEQHLQHHPRRTLHFEAAADIPPVEGHAGWTEQVIENLLTNAEKYSPLDTPIGVNVTTADGRVIIRVRDSGPGIAPEDAPHLFEPFYRSRVHAAKAGAGIGLAVCRRLVELQGGTIDVDESHSSGAAFVITLPVAAFADESDPADSA